MWYKDAVFYEVYPRAFRDSNADGHGDLAGLTQKLDYLQDLGVTCLWLLPMYPSPLADDGYDIADHFDIHPDYGTLEDFQNLVREAHRRGLRVIADLVLNHTSDQHPWFQSARFDRSSAYRDYYVWSDSNQKYHDARIIFLDTEKSNWAWDETAEQYYWHRFYSQQPDLNYDNPQVRQAMLNVMRFWLDQGLDGFRADAVPYLFEREGTNCENLPETHTYLKELRAWMQARYPEAVLLAEANQWPEDVRPYFGEGDEFHMGFHFPAMPRIFMALRRGERAPLEWILDRTPPLPETCQWCTFLRNHDELTLEMVTEEERQWMWQQYAPGPRMRLNLGIRRRLAPLLDGDRRRIELAHSLLFTLPGSPVLYYGDELGMGDNIWLPDRNGVRTPMQWNAGRNAGFSEADRLYAPVIDDDVYGPRQVNVEAQRADSSSLLHTLRRMIGVRKEQRAFGWGSFEWARGAPSSVAAYVRAEGHQRLLIVNNLSEAPQELQIPSTQLDAPPGQATVLDLLSGTQIPLPEDGQLTLKLSPYQYMWLRLA